MATVKLKILAGAGRHIFGYGAKERGEIVHVEEALARLLLEDDPAAYELVVDTVPLPPAKSITPFAFSKEEDKG